DFGDLQLQAGSPVIDHGSNLALPQDFADVDGDTISMETLPLDLAGVPRIVGRTVDQGAYEYPVEPFPPTVPIPVTSPITIVLLPALLLAAGAWLSSAPRHRRLRSLYRLLTGK